MCSTHVMGGDFDCFKTLNAFSAEEDSIDIKQR